MEYLLRYEVWFILALVLVGADVLLALDFILLAFGVGAAVSGLSLLFGDSLALPYTDTWEGILTFFAVVSLAILVPLRRFVRQRLGTDDKEDINKY